MDNHSNEQADTPFFSICLTTFDRGDLLRQTLGSILSQTFEDFEVVIGNNNTERPLSPSILEVDDARVRIINHPQNLGQLGNLNRLLELGRGRYITFIADDDLYAPDFLEAIFKALANFDYPVCVFTSYSLLYGASLPALPRQSSGQMTLYSGADFLRNYLLEDIKAIGIMGMFEAEYLRRMGGIEDVSADGVWVYLEYMLLIQAGMLEGVVHIPDQLICYRIHEGARGVASTDFERYYRAGEFLVRKSAEVLSDGFAGDRAETLLLVFNLALKQLLFKTGKQGVSLDLRAMLEKIDMEVAITSGNKTDNGAGKMSGLRVGIDVLSLLLQQFADAETGRISKEQELDAVKEKDEEIHIKDEEIRSLKLGCNTKDEEIRSLKLGCNTKDEEIRSLKQICEEREKVIFELDARRKLLERTNILGKALLLVRSVLLSLWLPIRHRVVALVTPRLGVLRQYPPRPLKIAPPSVEMPPAERLSKISIVTPSYNQAEYLTRTLDSVLGQGYPNLEYIVQDGASTDGSAEILKKYADHLVYWQSTPDGGQTNAINAGFKHATGEIMAWLNSDDMLLPGALTYIAAYFDAHPEVDVLYGHRVIVDEDDREIGRWVLPPHDGRVLSWADFVPQETLFWRRRAWDKVGGLDESFHFAMDWDFLLRLRESGAVFARVPCFLGAFRVHPQQKTTAEISDVGFKEMARLRERRLGRQPSHTEITKGVAPYLARHVVYDWAYRLQGLWRRFYR